MFYQYLIFNNLLCSKCVWIIGQWTDNVISSVNTNVNVVNDKTEPTQITHKARVRNAICLFWCLFSFPWTGTLSPFMKRSLFTSTWSTGTLFSIWVPFLRMDTLRSSWNKCLEVCLYKPQKETQFSVIEAVLCYLLLGSLTAVYI